MGEEPADRYSTVAAFEARRRRGALGRVDGRDRRGARPAAHAGAPSSGPSDPRISSTSSRWPGACGLDVAKAADVTRLFTMSVGDLLREWFESDAVQALMAVNGVIGPGPAPGAGHRAERHHSIGDVGAGSLGSGAIRGGAGRGA